VIGVAQNSGSIGGLVPDPMVMLRSKKRASMFSESLRNMQNKQFTYSSSFKVKGAF
jgi:hypothetical protein